MDVKLKLDTTKIGFKFVADQVRDLVKNYAYISKEKNFLHFICNKVYVDIIQEGHYQLLCWDYFLLMVENR